MTADQRLVLFTDSYWISPYVFTCFVALHEKVLPYETSTVSLDTGEHLGASFRDRSLTARVPALQHGDFWLAESSAIVEYLDDVFPDHPKSLPKDARDRGRARQIMAWIRSDLLALREERPTTTMFYEHAKTPLSKAGADAASKLLRVADLLIAEGATSLFGEFSVADADLAFMLHRLLLNGHEVPPKVRAFAEAQWQRPSVRAFVVRERKPLPAP
jgi:glutathione S-transferase